ncbi:hypothetical protein JCM33374_g6222 [Metschnikowia sp. JCM 33374]|nr:hypothetical protein JCM33374_g6222 [Metschnikowia sp. JCM 33374]
MDASGINQPGLNISFNPMSSGSIAATNSSGYTAVNSEDTDPELTYSSSLMPQSYEGGGSHVKSYQFHHNSPTTLPQNRIWNSRSNNTNSPGLNSSPSMINSMISSPRSDNQGIHLPSFMNNSIFDAASPRQNTQGGAVHTNQFGHADYSNISSMKITNKEPLGSPSQYNTYGQNIPSHIMASYQRKKQLSMNPSTSSYNSSMASASSFDNRSGSSDAKGNSQNSIEKAQKPSFVGTPPFDNSESETIEMLKSELSFKNQVNDSLKEKLKSLNMEEEMPHSEDEARMGDSIRLPKNYMQLFRDLTRTLNERTQELKETKSKIEAIIVGTVMNKDNSVDYYETFDAQDIAHRITNKLSVLQTENEALLNMVSYSNKQSLLIELGLLKNENKVLREKLEKVESEISCSK